MAPANIAQRIADAWDQAVALEGYGWEPLTVGWWRGQAFVRMWDFRTGDTYWRPFKTSRPEQRNPWRDPFASNALYEALFK